MGHRKTVGLYREHKPVGSTTVSQAAANPLVVGPQQPQGDERAGVDCHRAHAGLGLGCFTIPPPGAATTDSSSRMVEDSQLMPDPGCRTPPPSGHPSPPSPDEHPQAPVMGLSGLQDRPYLLGARRPHRVGLLVVASLGHLRVGDRVWAARRCSTCVPTGSPVQHRAGAADARLTLTLRLELAEVALQVPWRQIDQAATADRVAHVEPPDHLVAPARGRRQVVPAVELPARAGRR